MDVSSAGTAGNHRDAWTFGAVDRNSGTVTLLEIAQRLEKLQKIGWKSRRTICLMQLGRRGIGSAEWVEENREMLAARVDAYLNVDCTIQGGPFRASATLQLDDIIIEAARQLGRLEGAGSDYAAFVQHIGAPALDMSFGNVASILGLVALRLADDEVLPFNYISYAIELQKSTEDLEGEISDNGISLVPLYASIEKLRKAANKIKDDIKALRAKRRRASVREVRELNNRLIMTERAFTDRDGLLSRTWHDMYSNKEYTDLKHDYKTGTKDVLNSYTGHAYLMHGWCSPTSLNIPRAVWNPSLTRRGSPQPECTARVGVSESDTPQDI
ncbi:hypothetical protein CQW23_06674 [Capsicum baccatum]|uniref:Transferrin receptor-like dimerisation domain-containing protein n=1 Tax=Capsicum baccatum TaxID=33114 RepID=A0A2G2X3Z9_CAPBA|nr:hypothetical protein CQW23_06674 [Capsicum baccatum]